jgi:hypothetical protein
MKIQRFAEIPKVLVMQKWAREKSDSRFSISRLVNLSTPSPPHCHHFQGFFHRFVAPIPVARATTDFKNRMLD